MIDWLKVAIEVSILAFFALVYYLVQRRRLTNYHHNETVEEYALWIYDYHHYLDEIKEHQDYEALNAFIIDIEAVDLNSNQEKMELIKKIPSQMPKDLKERLENILAI